MLDGCILLLEDELALLLASVLLYFALELLSGLSGLCSLGQDSKLSMKKIE